MTEGSAVDRLFSSLDLSGIEDALRGSDGWGDLRFEQIVEKLISGEYDISQGLGQMVWQFFWGEWETNRKYLIYILLLTIAFSLLKNFAQVFEQSYISNVCFLLVYALLMVLLMKSVLLLDQVVQQTIAVVLDFMTAFVPVFATTVVVAGGDATAMGFYELGFLVVYLVQWILADGLVPLIRIYVVMGLLNYVMEEGRFSKLTDLLENMVSWALKILTSVVLGLNIIKNAIAPVTDTFARQTLRKSLAFVPGIGSTLSAASDLFLAASDVIRSGIGAAALVVLVILVAVPLSKVGIMTFFYRVLAAFVEPVADKRISNAILVAAQGGGMLFKLLTNCAILIFITVADDVIAWIKAYISLFLIFAMFLYLLPSGQYRRYLRFFLEMVLVLFCLTSILGIGKKDYEKQWNQTFSQYYAQWEQRKKEAEDYSYLDQNYIDAVVNGQEE